jgi:hypothetical protein
MLNNFAEIERNDEAAPNVFLIEERWIDLNLAGRDKLFYHVDESPQWILFPAFPARFHLVENSAGCFEGDSCQRNLLPSSSKSISESLVTSRCPGVLMCRVR